MSVRALSGPGSVAGVVVPAYSGSYVDAVDVVPLTTSRSTLPRSVGPRWFPGTCVEESSLSSVVYESLL